MALATFNPYSQERISVYKEEPIDALRQKISDIRKNQSEWRKDIDSRMDYLKQVLKPNLVKREKEIAERMTVEMGKPISQSIAEVRKCQALVDYAIANFGKFLEPEPVKVDGDRAYVRFDPLGVVLLVMPWNYPLWQAFRAAIPALTAGNGILLKHASIVTGSSLLIEEVMDTPLFKSAVISGANTLELLRYVEGVSFTGSTSVGEKIAQAAGKELKKAVLELGGSDPFIVLKSADLAKTAEKAAFGRLQNGGQSCIASKRFIVHEEVFDEFRSLLKDQFSSVVMGDPMDEKTFLGPLSSNEQAATVRSQIEALRSMGTVEQLGRGEGNIIAPVIASTDAKYDEEVFGPVAVLKKFKTNDEAVRIANETPFGLGSSVWGDPSEAESMAPDLEAGMVFVNKIVASDPRVPFGGVKKSGLGRELSRYGLLEFTNIKTTWVQSRP